MKQQRPVLVFVVSYVDAVHLRHQPALGFQTKG